MVTNPKFINSQPKPRNFRRIKEIAKALTEQQFNPVQADNTNNFVNEPNNFNRTQQLGNALQTQTFSLEDEVNSQRLNNRVPTKSLIFDKYPTDLGEPVYDEEKAKRLQQAQKVNMFGQGLASVFNTALAATGGETFQNPDITTPNVLNELRFMDRSHIRDYMRLRDQAMQNNLANIDMENRGRLAEYNAEQTAIQNEADRVASANELYQKQLFELEKINRMSEGDLREMALENGVNPNSPNWKEQLALERAKTTSTDRRYKNAMSDNVYLRDRRAGDDQFTDEDWEVMNYLNNEMQRLRGVLGSENYDQHEAAKSQLEYYQDIVKNPRKNTLKALSPAAKAANSQLGILGENSISEEEVNLIKEKEPLIIDRIKNQGITPENLSLYSQYLQVTEGLAPEQSEIRAKEDLNAIVESNNQVIQAELQKEKATLAELKKFEEFLSTDKQRQDYNQSESDILKRIEALEKQLR